MSYQPIVRTRDGSIFGWEALLRTREKAVPGPLVFLEMAERLGRVRDLGRQIRTSVGRTAHRNKGVVFFVNLHPEDLLDESLYDPSAPLSVLAPEVVLEITERSPIDSVPDVRERVARACARSASAWRSTTSARATPASPASRRSSPTSSSSTGGSCRASTPSRSSASWWPRSPR